MNVQANVAKKDVQDANMAWEIMNFVTSVIYKNKKTLKTTINY